jgi:hypothetical protein
MKFMFFACETRTIAAIRYRVESFARLLEQEGHSCVVCFRVVNQKRGSMRRGEGWQTAVSVAGPGARITQLRHVNGGMRLHPGTVFPLRPAYSSVHHFINKRLVMDLDDASGTAPSWKVPLVRFIDFGWTAKMDVVPSRCRGQ